MTQDDKTQSESTSASAATTGGRPRRRVTRPAGTARSPESRATAAQTGSAPATADNQSGATQNDAATAATPPTSAAGGLDVLAEFSGEATAPKAGRATRPRSTTNASEQDADKPVRSRQNRGRAAANASADDAAPANTAAKADAAAAGDDATEQKPAARGRRRKTTATTPTLDDLTAALDGALDEASRRHDGRPAADEAATTDTEADDTATGNAASGAPKRATRRSGQRRTTEDSGDATAPATRNGRRTRAGAKSDAPATTDNAAEVVTASDSDGSARDTASKSAATSNNTATSNDDTAAQDDTATRNSAAQDGTAEQDSAAQDANKAPARRSTRGGRSRSGRGAKAPLFSGAEEAAEQVETEEESTEIRLAATTLLFQAPDVAPRARRRKTGAAAQAGADEAVSGDNPDATEDEDIADADTAAATDTADHDAEVVDEVAQDLAELARSRGGDDSEADSDDDTDDEDGPQRRRRRRRGGRGRRKGNGDNTPDNDSDEAPEAAADEPEQDADAGEESESSSRRRRRRRRGSRNDDGDDSSNGSARGSGDQVVALKGSTRLEAKRQRRREGRDAGRRRQIITEAEFLARRESVDRTMIVRERAGRTQIAVLEDGVLVEHYVSQQSQASMAGNVYLGRVQNVLPSMEAAFVDIGKGRNAVLYAGEVNWDAAGIADGQPRRIEQALKSGDSVLVQVTKDPIGHKGARLTSQITLAGRYLVYVPGGGMTGISRKLPEPERQRLKRILRAIVPDTAGVIVRTAAEGATEEELTADIARLQTQWEKIEKKSKTGSAPSLLQGEPDMAIRVVRDIFNDDFKELIVSGNGAYDELHTYVHELAPDLESKMTKWTQQTDVFASHRIDEQLAKGMDRKVWLPSGGSLVIDRTEAMTVIDVNTGKFTGTGGTLEETVTRNNLEAAEEIVRQLRLRDIGGIVVVDFIDMVLESNRDLVLRRLVECLGRDRTRHQVAEVTSLGLVQMTRKRVGQGLVEAFSETCSHCLGRGFIVHTDPIERGHAHVEEEPANTPKKTQSRRRKNAPAEAVPAAPMPVLPEASSKEREVVKATLAQIAAAAAHAHDIEDGIGELPEVVEGAEDGVAVAPVVASAAVLDESSQPVAAVTIDDASENAAAESDAANSDAAETAATESGTKTRSSRSRGGRRSTSTRSRAAAAKVDANAESATPDNATASDSAAKDDVASDGAAPAAAAPAAAERADAQATVAEAPNVADASGQDGNEQAEVKSQPAKRPVRRRKTRP